MLIHRPHTTTSLPVSPASEEKTLAIDFFTAVPKVEIHVHLEGAIPLPALREIVSKYGGNPASVDSLRLFSDLNGFFAAWIWKNGFLREYDDFTFVAEAVARDMARQNIVYAEVFYSPPDFERHGLTPQQLTTAIRKGLDKVEDIEIALVADLVRDSGPSKGSEVLRDISEVKEACRVAGIGMGGSEHYPARCFKAVYRTARELGFRTTVHAGEACGPDSIWDAIRELEVERIGHGTKAVFDPALVQYLAENRIPVELCPVSNVRTGVVRSLKHHPARLFSDRGMLISINTDDPMMFENSLPSEYASVEAEMGFTREESKRLLEMSVESSWLPPHRKEQLILTMRKHPANIIS